MLILLGLNSRTFSDGRVRDLTSVMTLLVNKVTRYFTSIVFRFQQHTVLLPQLSKNVPLACRLLFVIFSLIDR